MCKTRKSKITKVEKIIPSEDTYVYDIGIASDEAEKQTFFGNKILLHNSVYFSADHLLDDKSDDAIVDFYDKAAEIANNSFTHFTNAFFNSGETGKSLINAERETVSSAMILVSKKKYGLNVIDSDGTRLREQPAEGENDIDALIGKVKITGLEIKKADTPKYIQDFLMEMLKLCMIHDDDEIVYQKIKKFREDFQKMDPWKMGRPKKVNSVQKFSTVCPIIVDENGVLDRQLFFKGFTSTNMAGHVKASVVWNFMRALNGDTQSEEIKDGHKIVVCELKPNQYGFTSIAYPLDQQILPNWFIDGELQIDVEKMRDKILTQTTQVVLGIMEETEKWRISSGLGLGFGDGFEGNTQFKKKLKRKKDKVTHTLLGHGGFS